MSEGDPRTQIREAAVWSLGAFRLNLLAFLVLSAIVAAVQFMQQVSLEPVNEVVAECANPESPGQQAACASELPMRLLTAGALTLVFAIAGFIVTIGVIRGALRATRGQTPAFDALLDGQYLGRYLGFQVLYALLVGFGDAVPASWAAPHLLLPTRPVLRPRSRYGGARSLRCQRFGYSSKFRAQCRCSLHHDGAERPRVDPRWLVLRAADAADTSIRQSFYRLSLSPVQRRARPRLSPVFAH